MADKHKRLQGELDGLLGHKGVIGAAIVSRDGIPVMSRFVPAFSQLSFSMHVEGAMIAALLGAAEVALSEVDGGATERVTIETAKTKMLVLGISEGLILVVLAEAGVHLETLVPAFSGTAESVRKIAAGEA